MTDYTWKIPDPVTQPEFYADVPTKRLIAWVVDTIFVLAMSLILVVLTAFTGIFFLPFLILTISLLYRTITITRGSATWGMHLMAIEFRTLRGQRFDGQMAFLHSLGFTISCMLPIFQVLSVILMLTSARGQGLTDHMLGTVAINRRAGQ